MDIREHSGCLQHHSSAYNVAQQWKALKEKTPEKLTRNLRTTVMLGLLQELHTRIQRVQEVEGAAQQAEERGWLRQGK